MYVEAMVYYCSATCYPHPSPLPPSHTHTHAHQLVYVEAIVDSPLLSSGCVSWSNTAVSTRVMSMFTVEREEGVRKREWGRVRREEWGGRIEEEGGGRREEWGGEWGGRSEEGNEEGGVRRGREEEGVRKRAEGGVRREEWGRGWREEWGVRRGVRRGEWGGGEGRKEERGGREEERPMSIPTQWLVLTIRPHLYVTSCARLNLSLMSELSIARMSGLHKWSLFIWGGERVKKRGSRGRG